LPENELWIRFGHTDASADRLSKKSFSTARSLSRVSPEGELCMTDGLTAGPFPKIRVTGVTRGERRIGE